MRHIRFFWHTHIIMGEQERPYLLLWTSVSPLNTKQHTQTILFHMHKSSLFVTWIFQKWGSSPNAVCGLTSSGLQMLAVYCSWTPGCYMVKMFKSVEIVRGGSEEHLHQQSLYPKNKTLLHEWMLERSSLFICLIITLRKLVDLEKSLKCSFFLYMYLPAFATMKFLSWLLKTFFFFFCGHERKQKVNRVHWNCCLCKVAEILFKFTFNNSTQRQKRNALLFCTHYAYLGSKL